ncbi:MAG TPA: trehalase-like domain-containing protein, partial [Actinomycetales bacterium]|nr:trehalase-like domain-containing protein [Actinomycetales bacterium]
MTSLAQLESTPISEYAVVGDMGTAALISRTGSVDWLCLPRFESPACFAALLGTKKHGHWLLTVRDAVNIDRRYVGETFILETVYTTARGKARVRDAMPLGNERADFVRHIEVLEGQVEIDHEWIVRFDYGDRTP